MEHKPKRASPCAPVVRKLWPVTHAESFEISREARSKRAVGGLETASFEQGHTHDGKELCVELCLCTCFTPCGAEHMGTCIYITICKHTTIHNSKHMSVNMQGYACVHAHAHACM